MTIAITAAATSAGVLAWGAPASADPDGKCSGGWVCLYENEDFNRDKGVSGDHWRNFKESKSNFSDFNWRDHGGNDSGDGMNDETSSIRNRTGKTIILYQDSGWSGTPDAFLPGSEWDDGKLSNDPIEDNEASSIYVP
ncbi:peptidase inhibitor family I36 protein [Nonomuraea sp. B19D2]|uniref:peptidase inhibitor family I36 protein n=1 Tax=Nonomuraea sp. B19D2 TaxID=3159561 RepID=UPI0032DB5C6E